VSAHISESEDSERTESDDDDEKGKGPPLPWWHRAQFPFCVTDIDRARLRKWAEHCKVWSSDNGDAIFKIPADLFAELTEFKIHDWYCMAGMFGAYAVAQCKGLDPKIRRRVIEYIFAVENLILKNVRRDQVNQRQTEIINTLAQLYPILPVQAVATNTHEQIQHWDKQVCSFTSLGGHITPNLGCSTQ
jgi:hypothetical protein